MRVSGSKPENYNKNYLYFFEKFAYKNANIYILS